MQVKSKGLDIEVQDSADAAADAAHRERPVVLLIIGLGLQLIDWPESFVQSLLDAGYRVVCFDNRDAGLSTHLARLGKPNLFWMGLQYKLGLVPHGPYHLADMATDALGVLDALHIEQAHVAGMSMGGMIAQRVALAAPHRVLSLTSMMSSSGARGLPGPEAHVLKAIMKPVRGKTVEALVEHQVALFKLLNGSRHAMADQDLREQIRLRVARNSDAIGVMRQMVALVSDVSRAKLLGRITAPTLVMHGKDDPLLPYACGEDTARRIPGARMVGIEGMGHDVSPVHFNTMAKALIAHMQAAQSTVSPASSAPL